MWVNYIRFIMQINASALTISTGIPAPEQILTVRFIADLGVKYTHSNVCCVLILVIIIRQL